MLRAVAVLAVLAACAPTAQGNHRGGVASAASPAFAQEAADEHCAAHNLAGRVTSRVGQRSYAFVCE